MDNPEESDTLTHEDNDSKDDTSNNTDHGVDNRRNLGLLSSYEILGSNSQCLPSDSFIHFPTADIFHRFRGALLMVDQGVYLFI